MRILLVNSVCGVTSTGRICTDLAKAFLENGHDVKIAYGRDDKGMPEEYENLRHRIGTDFDVKLHGFQTRFFDRHGFGSRRATKEFLKWVDDYKPDIIHLHNLHGYYINIEILFQYLKEKNIPVVWTLHDCWAMTGHCTHFTAQGCTKWKTGCSNCPLKHKYPTSMLLDNSKDNYHRKKDIFTGVRNLTITTPSSWLKSIVEQSYLKDYPVQVINNGIDTSIFKPTASDLRIQYGLTDQKIVLGVANGWGPHKGLCYLERMAGELPEGWKVVIVGLSEEQLEQLPGNIIGIKRTNSPQELAAWYTAADVFVNPTLEDTYSMTNIEAQACGTTVVTFSSGGAPESLLSGNGYIVERLQYDSLLEKTILASELKRGTINTAVKDKKFLGAEYLAVYQRLLCQEGVV